MEVKASLKYTRIGAQKARLVADVIRGKNVNDAVRTLSFMNKKSAPLFQKLILSAVANAEAKETIDTDLLYVRSVTVDQGPSLKRFKPAPQGRAQLIRKKMSHLNIVLSEKRVEAKRPKRASSGKAKVNKKAQEKPKSAKKKTTTQASKKKTTTKTATTKKKKTSSGGKK